MGGEKVRTVVASAPFVRETAEKKLILLIEALGYHGLTDIEVAEHFNAPADDLDGLSVAIYALGLPRIGPHHVELARTGDIKPPTDDKHGNTIERVYDDEEQMTMTIRAPDGKVLDVITPVIRQAPDG